MIQPLTMTDMLLPRPCVFLQRCCVVALLCTASVPSMADVWPRHTPRAEVPSALQSSLPAQAECRAFLEFASVPDVALALCRGVGTADPLEWTVLAVETSKAGPWKTRRITSMGEAYSADLQGFTAPLGCRDGGDKAACVKALVLVDHAAEFCWGTEVIALTTTRGFVRIGELAEVVPADDSERCVSPVARVHGPSNAPRITLPAPLLRTAKDGSGIPVKARAVTYRVTAPGPGLQRQAGRGD
ncbi:hypothetical protein OOT46_08840 [Aquabacterium sp. A7-Y]|uniref:hypothetical protein n=1 Tax=Aquabacterium sp. A7-Y TaxID=1349605 RepID=UPI00223CDCDB|nr:hypothetical protein [Aquabacterium sp. A7-Y]MCW7537955.1 hypothetical protein [Aquabacterium sp. A7-Y]